MTTSNVAQTGVSAFAAGDSAAVAGQSGIQAFASNQSTAALAHAGIGVFAANQPAALLGQSGVMAWGTLYNIYPYAFVANLGVQVFDQRAPNAIVLQNGIMAWVGYAQSITAPQAAQIIVKANGDIALVWDTDNGFADFQMSGPDLLTDSGLETAIILSLFTDRLADADDVIPDGSSDRRGWWGDAYSTASAVDGYPDLIGSRLWLLERSILTTTTLNQAQDYAEEALAWMLQDGVVGALTVTVTAVTINQMQILVNYTQAGSDKKFAAKWSTLA